MRKVGPPDKLLLSDSISLARDISLHALTAIYKHFTKADIFRPAKQTLRYKQITRDAYIRLQNTTYYQNTTGATLNWVRETCLNAS